MQLVQREWSTETLGGNAFLWAASQMWTPSMMLSMASAGRLIFITRQNWLNGCSSGDLLLLLLLIEFRCMVCVKWEELRKKDRFSSCLQDIVETCPNWRRTLFRHTTQGIQAVIRVVGGWLAGDHSFQSGGKEAGGFYRESPLGFDVLVDVFWRFWSGKPFMLRSILDPHVEPSVCW